MSMQMRNSPDFFVAIAIELIQSVGSVTGAITPFAVRLPISISKRGFGAKGTFLGGEITGCTVRSVSRCASPGKQPTSSLKTSLYSSIRSTLLSSAVTWRILLIVFVHSDDVHLLACIRSQYRHQILCDNGK